MWHSKPLVRLLISVCFFALLYAYTTVPPTTPVGNTGAPGEQSCARSGCHSTPANAGDGSISLLFPEAFYKPDSTYRLQLKVADTAKSRFGFQLIALDSFLNQAGQFNLIAGFNTNKAISSNKTYISHKDADTTSFWEFEWVAPDSNFQGNVFFYYAGNAANGNGNNGGDNIYTSFLKIFAEPDTNQIISAINQPNDVNASSYQLYPNPAVDLIQVNSDELVVIEIYSFAGELVLKEFISKANILSISQLARGSYLYSINNGTFGLLNKL